MSLLRSFQVCKVRELWATTSVRCGTFIAKDHLEVGCFWTTETVRVSLSQTAHCLSEPLFRLVKVSPKCPRNCGGLFFFLFSFLSSGIPSVLCSSLLHPWLIWELTYFLWQKRGIIDYYYVELTCNLNPFWRILLGIFSPSLLRWLVLCLVHWNSQTQMVWYPDILEFCPCLLLSVKWSPDTFLPSLLRDSWVFKCDCNCLVYWMP